MSSMFKTNRSASAMSRNMRSLGVENSRTMKSLDLELSRLETEKKNRMRELNHASRHFLDLQRGASSARWREASPDRHNGAISRPKAASCSLVSHHHLPRTPSPNPRSPLDDLSAISGSLSPRRHTIVYRKSLSTDEGGSPKQLSPTSSPESPRKLLSKRNEETKSTLQTSPNLVENNFITNVAYSGSCKQTLTNSTTISEKSPSKIVVPRRSNQSGIPQIVVSDTTPKLPAIHFDIADKIEVPNDRTNPKTSIINNHSVPRVEKDNTDSALNVPLRRSRSNSVPDLGVPADCLLAVAKKESSLTSIERNSGAQAETSFEVRPRSSSVCVPYYEHLKNAPRRDSLLRKYIARPKIYHRTAKTIDQLICDVAKGICNGDLDTLTAQYKPISREEWERLKQCRYLRMPGKNEDVKGNTLDIDEIFPHPT